MATAEEWKRFGSFLRARRAEVSPESVGLPPASRLRRVTGLRREEVAHLAKVSEDYYKRLEQGRVPAPSDSVLTAIAQALRLNPDEDRYLRAAAERTRQPQRAKALPDAMSSRLLVLLTHLGTLPAIAVDPFMDIIAWNELAAAFWIDFSQLPPAERNIVRLVYLNDDVRSRFKDWPSAARTGVALLRMGDTSGLDDTRQRKLVSELSRTDPVFASVWDSQTVASASHGLRTYVHPLIGEVRLEWLVLTTSSDPRIAILVLTPPADGSADSALKLLQNSIRPQAAPANGHPHAGSSP